MLAPILYTRVDVPQSQEAWPRFECAYGLMCLLRPGYTTWIEGCELTVAAETEEQLREWVTGLQNLCNGSVVTISVDDQRYECVASGELLALLRHVRAK